MIIISLISSLLPVYSVALQAGGKHKIWLLTPSDSATDGYYNGTNEEYTSKYT